MSLIAGQGQPDDRASKAPRTRDPARRCNC